MGDRISATNVKSRHIKSSVLWEVTQWRYRSEFGNQQKVYKLKEKVIERIGEKSK